MTDPIKKQVVAILVDNEFGALARIVELFSARGCNIETLNVSPITSDKKISRITITSYCSTKSIDLICISSMSFAKSYNFFNSTLEIFDLINDLDNSTTVSPAISSVFAAIL